MIRFLKTADNKQPLFPFQREMSQEWIFDENEFLTSFGDRYGYSGELKGIRKQEFGRFEGNKLVLSLTKLNSVGLNSKVLPRLFLSNFGDSYAFLSTWNLSHFCYFFNVIFLVTN